MIKRIFDVFVSGVALVLLSPLLVLAMIVLRLTGEGEMFYRQDRVGRYREHFHIIKFATMMKESPNLTGGDITVRDDPRVLPVGKLLRKTKINELPQLWNVFTGDMSLIGPRPLTPRVYEPFPEEYKKAVATVRPGLSGIGSVVFRDEEKLLENAEDRERVYNETITPYKAVLENWYVENQGFWLDIKLMLLTVGVVLSPLLEAEDYLDGLPRQPGASSAHAT